MVGVGLLALAGQAQAGVFSSNLTSVTSPTGFPAGTTFGGTVTITDIIGGVSVDVTLAPGLDFIHTADGNGDPALFYNLDKAPSAVSVPAQFMSIGKFGNFSNAVFFKPTLGSFHALPVPGPLDFTVMGVTASDFSADADGIIFSAFTEPANAVDVQGVFSGTQLTPTLATAVPSLRPGP